MSRATIQSMKDSYIVAGCMTGTSMDALDVSVLRVSGKMPDIHFDVLDHGSLSLGFLTEELRPVAHGQPITIQNLCQLEHAFSKLHLELLLPLKNKWSIDLVAVHGQTLFHQPPYTHQLIESVQIAHTLECPVVSQLRLADMANGGQGAPITPLADKILFSKSGTSRAIVNLGGFCNITHLPASDRIEDIHAYDLCVCNQLLDRLARKYLRQPYDEYGLAAASGEVLPELFESYFQAFENQKNMKLSLGTGDELQKLDMPPGNIQGKDHLASVCEALAKCIVKASSESQEIILAGGGALHEHLKNRIRQNCNCTVITSDDLGIPASHRESMAMALLGYLCQQRVPITLPQVTGVRAPAPVSGCWSIP